MRKRPLLLIGILCVAVGLPLIVPEPEQLELNQQTRQQLGGQFINLSYGVTHYELKGQPNAKTIVLIHGNAVPSFSWDYTFEALIAAGYRVLRFDLYGHGYSDRPRLKTYDAEFYTQQLKELLEALSISTPVSLVGTSQGGSICMHFTARYPNKVNKLALLAPFYNQFNGASAITMLRVPYLGEYLLRLFGHKVLSDPTSVLYTSIDSKKLTERLKEQLKYKGKRRAVLANLRGNALNDASPYYEKVRQHNIPLQLVWGRDDKRIPSSAMNQLTRHMPDAKYIELEQAGHLLHYESYDRVNPILLDFFAEN